MERVLDIASYVYVRYMDENGKIIDEMKLHKLMYFAQRESFIQKGVPLFDAVFYGWKYGPVLREIREAYRNKDFSDVISEDLANRIRDVMDKVFLEYSHKDSWSLSRLTHGELSWKNARMGVPDGVNSDNPISNEDIKKDAARIRERREMRALIGLGGV